MLEFILQQLPIIIIIINENLASFNAVDTNLEFVFKRSRGVRDSLHKLIHPKSGMSV